MRATWRAVAAGVVFGRRSVVPLAHELGRNPALLAVCGSDPLPRQGRPRRAVERVEGVRGDDVAHGRGVARSAARFRRSPPLPQGQALGYDGKGAPSHSTGRVSGRTGAVSDRDADWGRHETRGVDGRTGRVWTKVKSWFGHRVHLMADTCSRGERPGNAEPGIVAPESGGVLDTEGGADPHRQGDFLFVGFGLTAFCSGHDKHALLQPSSRPEKQDHVTPPRVARRTLPARGTGRRRPLGIASRPSRPASGRRRLLPREHGSGDQPRRHPTGHDRRPDTAPEEGTPRVHGPHRTSDTSAAKKTDQGAPPPGPQQEVKR